jgi:hypothetical protein
MLGSLLGINLQKSLDSLLQWTVARYIAIPRGQHEVQAIHYMYFDTTAVKGKRKKEGSS